MTLWSTKEFVLLKEKVMNSDNAMANGWSLSNHDRAYVNSIQRGDGENVEKIKSARTLATAHGGSENNTYESTARHMEVDSDGYIYLNPRWEPRVIKKISPDGETVTTIITQDRDIGGMTLDHKGGIYFSVGGIEVLKADTNGENIEVVIGNGSGYSDLAIDTKGNLYIADTYDIRRLNSDGVMTTVAPLQALTMDMGPNDELFFSMANNTIKKIDQNDNITTVAGNGTHDNCGVIEEFSPATTIGLCDPANFTVDSNGRIFFLNGLYQSELLYMIEDGLITNVIGFGVESEPQDGMDVASINLDNVDELGSLAVDAYDNIYIPMIIDNRDPFWGGSGIDFYGIKRLDYSALFKQHDLLANSYIYLHQNNTADIFDVKGLHQKRIDLNSGHTLTTYGYDSSDRLTSVSDQYGNTLNITRDASGKPTQIIAPNGQITHLQVDGNGNLAEVRYEDDSKYSFEYDNNSLMTKETDPNDNIYIHEFDANGRITKDIDGINGEWRFDRTEEIDHFVYRMTKPENDTLTYNDYIQEDGSIRSEIIRENGDVVIQTISKDQKNLERTKEGVTTIENYILDPQTGQERVQNKTITQPSGLSQTVTYRTTYDKNATYTTSKTKTVTIGDRVETSVTNYTNGIQTTTSPEGRVEQIEFDKESREIKKVTTGSLTPVEYEYDTKGRITKEYQGDSETTYTYDTRGNVATITNPRGKTTTYTYDTMDRITTITYPNTITEQYEYDNNGNVKKLITPIPTDFTFSYNGVDKRTAMTSPMSKTTIYTYDKNRRLTQILKPSGTTITNTYQNGTLHATITPEGTTTYNYLYQDKVDTITKGSEAIHYTYDGDLITKIEQSGLLNQDITLSYNSYFEPTSITYAGASNSLAYDKDSLLTQSGEYILTCHAQNAHVTNLTDGTLTQTRSYNDFGEIVTLSDNSYGYTITKRNPNGMITKLEEQLESITIHYEYSYDDNDRLIQVKKEGTVVETYSYDRNGNRQSATVNGTTHYGIYTLDDQIQSYGGDTYTYNDDGYLIAKGTTTYDYGSRGELKSVTTPTQTITYLHNANNQRVAKKVNGTITEKYLWQNLTKLLAVYDGNDNLLMRFEYADQRVPTSMTKNGSKYYLHYNQVGSLRAVTDNSHNLVKAITYDTFGTIIQDSDPTFKVPFGFAGGLYDSDTKLVRFGYRDYDAFTGKWTAKDPIDFAGGDSNLYGYVLGDPVNLVDPLGLASTVSDQVNGIWFPGGGRDLSNYGGIHDAGQVAGWGSKVKGKAGGDPVTKGVEKAADKVKDGVLKDLSDKCEF
jgi:RHS repeat-associated protein